MKLISKAMILFCLTFLVACTEQVEFSSDDVQVTDLIYAIEQYILGEGQAPENLEDLVPTYMSEVPMPEWASSIVYQYEVETDSWTLKYLLKNGGNAVYHSQSGWMIDAFPRDP